MKELKQDFVQKIASLQGELSTHEPSLYDSNETLTQYLCLLIKFRCSKGFDENFIRQLIINDHQEIEHFNSEIAESSDFLLEPLKKLSHDVHCIQKIVSNTAQYFML